MSESVMSKHTPGPWFAIRNSAYWEVFPNNPGMGVPWTVADICPSDPGNPDGGLQEANARLIAAAPELREIVRRLIEWHCGPIDKHVSLCDIVSDAEKLWEKMQSEVSDGIDSPAV